MKTSPRRRVAAGVLLAITLLSGCAQPAQPAAAGPSVSPAAVQAAAPAAAAPEPPGTDESITGWFHSADAAKIRYNNLLLLAGQDIAAGSSTNCPAFLSATRMLDGYLTKLQSIPHGGAELAALYARPNQLFAKAAQDCVARKFPAAQAELATAVTAYQHAQQAVDEVLDGD